MRRVVIILAVLAAACSGRGGGPPLRKDELIKACVLYAGCIGGGVDDCLGGTALRFAPDVWRCVIAAGSDCTASRACFGATVTTVTSCESGCDGDATVQCAGTTVEDKIECGSPFANTGPKCFIDHLGNADCGAGVCTTSEQICDGDVAQSCNEGNGVLHRIDCDALGLTCAGGVCTSPGGGGACRDDPTHCVGSALELCDFATFVRYDCPSRFVGADCFETAAGAQCGYGPACDADGRTATCNGTTVSFCAAGISGSVDCTSLGFEQCQFGRCVSL
jgi:hypothetical protein